MNKHSNKRHYPDLLFYFLLPVSILSTAGFIYCYPKYISLNNSVNSARDSLTHIKKIFGQGKLISIINKDSIPWLIGQMTIVYKKDDSLVTFEKMVAEIIQPDGELQFQGNKYFGWDNSCLFYSFRIKGETQNRIIDRVWVGQYGKQMNNERLIITAK